MRGQFEPKAGFGTRQYLVLSNLACIFVTLYLCYAALPYCRHFLSSAYFGPSSFIDHLYLLIGIMPLWYILLEYFGLYAGRRLGWGLVLGRTLRVQLLGLAILSAGIFSLKLTGASRLIVLGFCVLYVPLSIGTRWLVLSLLEAHRSHVYNVTRVLVIGTKQRARDFIRRVKSSDEKYYEVVGCLDPSPSPAQGEVEGVPVLGTTEIFRSYLFQHPIDSVVFGMPTELVPGARDLIEAALELGLSVRLLPNFYVHQLGFEFDDKQVFTDSVVGLPVVGLSSMPPHSLYLVAKRVMDVVVSGILLILLAPLFLLIVVLIKLTSPGPIFYRWHVPGVNKKLFWGYKFRTMVANAEQLRSQLMAHNEMQGPAFKMRDDPRVTPLGRLLRRYSLDELPQLYCVLKGNMSLVGPRPSSKEDADRFDFWHRRKLSVKPGITCLWQISGRSDIRNFDDWARLDLEYIRNASFGLDCKVLLKTIPIVFRGKGAY